MKGYPLIIEGPDGPMEEWIAAMRKGDPRCPIKVEARVQKVWEESPGKEFTPIGSLGTVTGSFFKETNPEGWRCVYMVLYDGNPHETANIEPKIKPI